MPTANEVITFTAPVRYHVNIIRTNHNERVLMVTANGKVVFEKLYSGRERLPMLQALFKLQKLFNCDRE